VFPLPVGVKIRSIVFGVEFLLYFGAEFLLYLKQSFHSVPSSGGSFRFFNLLEQSLVQFGSATIFLG
jgi:hypothetical protein